MASSESFLVSWLWRDRLGEQLQSLKSCWTNTVIYPSIEVGSKFDYIGKKKYVIRRTRFYKCNYCSFSWVDSSNLLFLAHVKQIMLQHKC